MTIPVCTYVVSVVSIFLSYTHRKTYWLLLLLLLGRITHFDVQFHAFFFFFLPILLLFKGHGKWRSSTSSDPFFC